MPKVEVSVNIKKPKEEVYKVIKDMESFPLFMRHVKNLKIIKRWNDGIITAWSIEIEGAPVNWREEDFFNDANYELKFNMIEGDYEEYEGRWLLQDYNNSTKLTLEANFDWGIPVLEMYVGKALEKKARRSLLGMVQAVKNKAER
jgi:ribosome-associated toxin RatA of RatAB toxin-antitoxin module